VAEAADRENEGVDPAVHLNRIDPGYLEDAADAGHLYAIVDGCAVPGLVQMARDHGEAYCLYLGDAATNYGDKAPWLFAIRPGERDALVERFGNGVWGCFIISGHARDRVRRHLRSLLAVRSPAGERWLFRFWDPRVLPAYLRASTVPELNAFFGPVSAFGVIDPAGRSFGAWRDKAIIAPARRRGIGEPLAISTTQVTALRQQGMADRLAKSFGPGQAEVTPERDAVVARASGGGALRLDLAANGMVSGVTSPLGRRWRIDSHEDGRLATLVTPSGSKLAIDYDPAGRIARVSRDGAERFRASHDATGRPERIDFPDGTAACTDYAWRGRAALGDPGGQLIAGQRDRVGRVERFGYDGVRLVAAADGANQVTQFDYETGPRPDATRYADGRIERYRYDPAGHVARIVRPSDRTLDVACDDAGRPVRIAAADGTVATFAYDDAGRLVAATNGEVELAWVYDAAGLLVEERQGDAVVRHLYDATGHVGLVYPTGEAVRWRRDADQRIVEVIDWSGGHHGIAYADDDAGWRMVGPGGVVETHRPDRTGFPSASRVEADGALLWETSWTHDAEDRLTARGDTRIGPAAWRYDAEGQVIAVRRADGSEVRFAYDDAGNRVSGPDGAATFDACNRIVTHGAESFRHDADGALIERSGTAGGWRYRHDGLGRMIEARDGTDRVLTFGYDPLGRRIWKRAQAGRAETLTQFVWAGEQMIREVVTRSGGAAEWQGGGRAAHETRDHCYWPLGWTPLLMRTRGVVHRCHTAPSGTPLRLTTPEGRVVWEADHDAFGRARVFVHEVDQPLRLPGQYADDEFGFSLHYNRHRFYNPDTGRYVTPDPMGVAGGLNLYLYAGNDPLNRADPLGLWWKAALSVVGAVAVAAVVVVTAPVTAPLALVVIGAGAAAGAAGFMVNEALNQEEFCLSCILVAGLKGALVGAVAAVPFVFVPATAGVLAFAGVGASSGLLGYGAEVALTDREWSWRDAAIAGGIGAVTAGAGRYLLGGRAPAPPGARPQPAPSAGIGTSVGARFGNASSNNYKATFFEANPALKGKVVVHHAVEQQVLKRYPGVVKDAEMHSLENLRGIPKEVNSDLHLSQIRREWNQFYRQNATPTKQQLLDKAAEIDRKYGSQFNPPVE
jgi:RHS repeat-associated protein